MKMIIVKNIFTIIGVLVTISVMVAVGFAIPTKKDKATYEITSENGKRYYANSFRVYGRGIVFDDVYGRKVIVQGDLEIINQNTENN